MTQQEILHQVQAHGILIDRVVFDGALRRYPTQTHPRSKNAHVTGFADGMGAWCGDWSQGWEQYFGTNGTKLTEADRARIDAAKAEARRIRDEQQAAAADRAAALYAKAKPASPDHPYLQKKRVPPCPGLRQSGKLLMLPVMDESWRVTSLQYIAEDGSKRFLRDGAVGGGFFAIKGADTIGICEGYATGATIHAATGWTVLVAFNAGNLLAVAEMARKKYPSRRIVICADNDLATVGNPGLRFANAAALAVGGLVALPECEGVKCDFNDLHQAEGLDEVRRQLDMTVEPTQDHSGDYSQANNQPPLKIVPVDIASFLGMTFESRENLLHPWLGKQSIAMVHAWRGVGKTHFALNAAYAVTTGGTFLGWNAPQAAGIMYLDGEMPGPVMQERLAAIVAASDREPQAPFILVTPDLQADGMPKLDTAEGQAAIDAILTPEIRLIIVDNLSTLTACKENEADAWTPFQGWALRQRAHGRAILFIHHSNKSGNQRGTSRREDVLDTVLCLKRPVDYQPDQGAVFEIHYEKARGLWGQDVLPIEARLTTDEQGRVSWTTRSLDLCNFDKVVALLNEGLSQREVADELGLNKSTVSRHARRAKADGLIKEVQR